MEIKGEYKIIDISELKAYEKNARKHSSQQISKIKDSISAFDFINDVIVDENGMILCGHGRVEAAKKMKLKQVPCKVIKHLTDAQKRAYILADNRLAELADWDMDMVQAELDDLAVELDVGIIGFDLPEEENTDGGASGSQDQSFSYQEQFGVIIMCKDEAHQKKVYEDLSKEGYECKVVAT